MNRDLEVGDIIRCDTFRHLQISDNTVELSSITEPCAHNPWVVLKVGHRGYNGGKVPEYTVTMLYGSGQEYTTSTSGTKLSFVTHSGFNGHVPLESITFISRSKCVKKSDEDKRIPVVTVHD